MKANLEKNFDLQKTIGNYRNSSLEEEALKVADDSIDVSVDDLP